jgi:hypothetical protein
MEFVIFIIVAVLVVSFFLALSPARKAQEPDLIEQKRAALPPLTPNALMQATIEPISTTGVVVFIQLSERARNILGTQNLWNAELFDFPNPQYAAQLQDYKRRWDDYRDAKKSHIEMVRWTARQPTDPEPRPRTSVVIGAFCADKGYFRNFPTTGEAQNWIVELRKHIEKLKEIIEHQSRPLQRETFTL